MIDFGITYTVWFSIYNAVTPAILLLIALYLIDDGYKKISFVLILVSVSTVIFNMWRVYEGWRQFETALCMLP